MDRFAEMQMFVRIVEAGSFSGAASRLDIARSVVNRRLAELEARLGAELLHRTTRRLSLTESGRTFYSHCKRLLADIEEAELSVSQAHGSLVGGLRVALPLSFGLLQLAPLINDFMARHPQVTIDLDFNDRQVDLIQEGIDVAIRIAQLQDSSLIARRLCSILHHVCASPDYLAQHGWPSHPDELATHRGLVYANAASPDVWTYRTAQGAGGSVRIPVRLRANNGDMLVQAALAGAGIIMVPTFFLREALRSGRLVPLLTEYQWPEPQAYAVYPSTRHLSTRVRAFVDHMAEALAGTPAWER